MPGLSSSREAGGHPLPNANVEIHEEICKIVESSEYGVTEAALQQLLVTEATVSQF